MKFILAAIGKTNEAYLREGIDKYVSRLKHYVPFEMRILADIRQKNLTEDMQKQKEGELILSQLRPGDVLVLLDERGKEFTSREFADYVHNKMVNVAQNVFFVIGGPYGFSKDVYARANDKISLSKMTFSHEMVRLFITEQIYRAMTILRGEPYHHD